MQTTDQRTARYRTSLNGEVSNRAWGARSAHREHIHYTLLEERLRGSAHLLTSGIHQAALLSSSEQPTRFPR